MMKDLLDRHEERMTPEEESRVWSAISGETTKRARRRGWLWVPAGLVAATACAGIVFLVQDRAKLTGVGQGAPDAARRSNKQTRSVARELSLPPRPSAEDRQALKAFPYIGGSSPQAAASGDAGVAAVSGLTAPGVLGQPAPGVRQIPATEAPYAISVGGTDPVNGQPFDAMFFEHYGVNPFIDPEEDRFATFAVDVDNASWTMTRAWLERAELPPKDAVRVEEFVNAFRHDYPPPRSRDLAGPGPVSANGTFAIHLAGAPSPFGNGLNLLRVGLKGRDIAVRDRKPASLTFVVDVSGSMAREDRLELVKKALTLLLDQMTSDDQVGLVVYGSDARTILDHTSLKSRDEIVRAIESLAPEGATNAEAGLLEGYRMADRNFSAGRLNRVILCSDGVANVGQTGADDILARIRREAGRGIELTTIGFGMGNYNDVLMEKLADQGDGNYYYVDTLREARRVFIENLTGTLQTIARQTKIQVEFNPEAVRRYRLLGYENRDVADRDFRNDAVDAGEVGAGHEVTALFEMKLTGASDGDSLATVRIRYEDPETGAVTEEARGLLVGDARKSLAEAPASFRLDAAVAEFAEILRHSYWAKEGSFETVAAFTRDQLRDSEGPELEEFKRLVETAAKLEVGKSDGKDGDRPDVKPEWEPDSE